MLWSCAKFPKTLDSKESSIIKRKGQTRNWYESQFYYFTEKEAKKACSIMKKNKVDCFVKKKT